MSTLRVGLPFAGFELSLHGTHAIELTSLLLTYVQICSMVARVISNNPAIYRP